MTCQPPRITLTDEQKAQVYGILSVGCDRQTAADFIGCRPSDIRDALQNDLPFLARVRRAEARAELSHMGNIHEAAKEKKDWRASVWWLERRSPDRFGRRGPGTVTARQLKAFVKILLDILSSEITNQDDRQRVIDRLREIGDAAEKLLREVQISSSDIAEAVSAEDSLLAGESRDDLAGGFLRFHGED
jgi:hypothetical protein